MAIFITDIAVIVVLVCCLYFRLATSMMIYLFIYLVYYFFLFDDMGKFMENMDFYERIEREYQSFRLKEQVCCQEGRSMITG